MARDVSIMISAKDNYSAALQKMQKAQTAFRKDLGQLDKELTKLNNNKISLKTDLTKAKNELKQAEKAFKATGDEAARLQAEAAQANYDNIKSNLDLVSRAAKQTQRDMDNLTGVMSKTETRAASTGSMFGQLAKAGLFAQLGTAVAGAGGALAKSALGDEVGNAVTTVLTGAATGAAMGMIAGPAGAAIGAGVGLVAGGIQAATQAFESRDDAFTGAVEKLYDEVTSGRAEKIAAGSDIAAAREMRKIGFTTMLGDEAQADKFLADMRKFAVETPFGEDDLAKMSRSLLAFGFSLDEVMYATRGDGSSSSLLTALGDAGAALGLTGEDVGWMASALGKMNTTGKTSVEFLNILLERGIPVYDYLAEATGKSNKQVQEMLSKGLIPGQDAARLIAMYMGEAFGGSMELSTQTFQGVSNALEEVQANMNAAYGEGYNTVRAQGKKDELAYYDGAGGEKMAEANRLIGEYEASLENLKEQKLREAMDDAWTKIDEEGITSAAEQGRILQAAQAKGASEYAATEQVKEQNAQNLELVRNIRETMTPEYYDTGRVLGLEMTKGIASAFFEFQLPKINMPGWLKDFMKFRYDLSLPGLAGKAFGQTRVPYDNYPVLLHEGERVLTAGQARRGETSQPMITGNNFYIREEADVYKVASAIADELAVRDLGYVG